MSATHGGSVKTYTDVDAMLAADEGLIGDVHYGEIDYYHGIGPWYGQ